MTTIIPNIPPIFTSRKQVTAALERAAARARVIAAQTGTKLVLAPVSMPSVPLRSKTS